MVFVSNYRYKKGYRTKIVQPVYPVNPKITYYSKGAKGWKEGEETEEIEEGQRCSKESYERLFLLLAVQKERSPEGAALTRPQKDNQRTNSNLITILLQRMAEEWKTLSDADKQKYVDMHQVEKDRYNREMLHYKSQKGTASESKEVKQVGKKRGAKKAVSKSKVTEKKSVEKIQPKKRGPPAKKVKEGGAQTSADHQA